MIAAESRFTRTIHKVAKVLLITITFFFVARYVHSNWTTLKNKDWSIQWEFFLLSFASLWVTFLLSVFFWKEVLVTLGANIGYLQAWKTYYRPLLSKYLPGKVWSVLGLAYFAIHEDVSPQIAVAAAGLFQAAALPGFSLAFLITIPFWRVIPSSFQIALAISAVLIILIASHPKILLPTLNIALKIMHKPEVNVKPSPLQMYKLLVAISGAISLAYGIAFAIFARAIASLQLGDFPILVGTFCLALLMGLVSIFVPAGVGVRESVLLAILSKQFSPDLAIMVSIGSRLWFTVAEVSFVGISWLLLRGKRNE